jgi:hypothetical protein
MDNGGTWAVFLNVTNMFDRGPPIMDSTYDLYGRQYYVSFNASF